MSKQQNRLLLTSFKNLNAFAAFPKEGKQPATWYKYKQNQCTLKGCSSYDSIKETANVHTHRLFLKLAAPILTPHKFINI